MTAMAEPIEREVELGSGRTRVQIRGGGQPFIWTHGFTSSIDSENESGMDALFGALPGVQMVRYDARGHGRSAAAREDADGAWHALAGDLLELCGALGLARPVSGGVSMGTATTLHAALRAPDAFAAMVLLMPPTAWETRKAQADLYRGGAALIAARGVDAYLDAMRAAFRANPMPGFDEERQEAMLAGLRTKSAADLARMLRGAAASDLPDPARLRGLEIPALVIATRGDPGHPLSTAERLVELLPNAELRVIDSLLELGSVRDELARFLTAPGARFARARADQIDVYSPDRYAAGAPYADFARLRRERPVHWQPTPDGGGYWALTKHADVAEVSRDPELFSSAAGFVVIEPLSEAQLAMMRFTLLGMDPPEHLRFRQAPAGLVHAAAGRRARAAGARDRARDLCARRREARGRVRRGGGRGAAERGVRRDARRAAPPTARACAAGPRSSPARRTQS